MRALEYAGFLALVVVLYNLAMMSRLRWQVLTKSDGRFSRPVLERLLATSFLCLPPIILLGFGYHSIQVLSSIYPMLVAIIGCGVGVGVPVLALFTGGARAFRAYRIAARMVKKQNGAKPQ